MLKVAHVHDRDAGLVQLLDGPCRWYADSTDEEPGLLLDDDINEVWQLALRVVVLESSMLTSKQRNTQYEVTHVGLACIAANLRDEQVNTKGCVLVVQVVLDRMNLDSPFS